MCVCLWFFFLSWRRKGDDIKRFKVIWISQYMWQWVIVVNRFSIIVFKVTSTEMFIHWHQAQHQMDLLTQRIFICGTHKTLIAPKVLNSFYFLFFFEEANWIRMDSHCVFVVVSIFYSLFLRMFSIVFQCWMDLLSEWFPIGLKSKQFEGNHKSIEIHGRL